jgi:hypothetical protein
MQEVIGELKSSATVAPKGQSFIDSILQIEELFMGSTIDGALKAKLTPPAER